MFLLEESKYCDVYFVDMQSERVCSKQTQLVYRHETVVLLKINFKSSSNISQLSRVAAH